MWAYLPRIFTETMVRTIQCQVVSYNGWKAHGLRLNVTFILGKDSRWISHISSTRTSCQNDRNAYLCPFAGHAFPSSTCKIAVSQAKVAVESARTLIRLRAATVKRLLKESASGASSSFGSDARGLIYMLRALIKAPNWFASAGSLQLSVWGAVPEAQAALYWSCLDCRPCCSSQHMQTFWIANSSTLQMAMITKPTSLPPQILQTMVPNHPKPSGELGWLQCPWLSTVLTSSKIYPL